MVNLGKYASPMDPLGLIVIVHHILRHIRLHVKCEICHFCLQKMGVAICPLKTPLKRKGHIANPEKTGKKR